MENYKTLKKEIGVLQKLLETYTMFMDRKNVIKMSILPKAIYRFNAIPIKTPMAFFCRMRTNISKIYMNQKEPKQPQGS